MRCPGIYRPLSGAALCLSVLSGCGDAESFFTDGRIEQRCNEAIPICNAQASCVLQDDQFLRDDFPGGKVFMVQTEAEETELVARFLLVDPRASGTELFVRVHTTACGTFEEGRTKDRDLIDYAGDDGIIDYELTIKGRGDHLVEIFSDMSSNFLFRFDRD